MKQRWSAIIIEWILDSAQDLKLYLHKRLVESLNLMATFHDHRSDNINAESYVRDFKIKGKCSGEFRTSSGSSNSLAILVTLGSPAVCLRSLGLLGSGLNRCFDNLSPCFQNPQIRWSAMKSKCSALSFASSVTRLDKDSYKFYFFIKWNLLCIISLSRRSKCFF